jgi:hypothetical protein
MMDVSLTNEVSKDACCFSVRVHGKIQGPVTFTIDSRKFEYVNSSNKNSKDNSRIDLAPQPSNN